MVLRNTLVAIFFLLSMEGLLMASELPEPLKAVRPQLLPVGSATLRWFGIHVYDITLYAEDQNFITNGAAVLSIRYHISIKNRRLQETTLDEWKRMGQGSPEQQQLWINQLDTIWTDIKSGERLSAYRQADGATQFYFGDRLLGGVNDKAFGPAFFAIWLGDNCRYPKLRDEMVKPNLAREKKGR